MATDSSARPEFVAAHVRRLEAMRRAGHVERRHDGGWTIPSDYLAQAGEYERVSALSRSVGISLHSSLPLKQMETAIGATWLDKSLVSDDGDHSARGFGGEVERAKALRRTFLFKSGVLKTRDGQLTKAHLDELECRDLANAGQDLARELGKPYAETSTRGQLNGIYARSVDRPSGKYAVIERAKDFTLVPWRDVLERQRGKSVSGLLRGKTVSWSFGKGRGVV